LVGCRDHSSAPESESSGETDGSAGSSGGSTTGDPGDELPPEACEGGLGRQQLRLLTRREYESTVHDLFGLQAADSCQSDAACPDSSTCQDGRCLLESTPPLSFSFDAQGQSYASVHVAGSFNGWPGTIADGGLALTFDETSGTWSGSLEVDAGTYEYKFVLDEATWISDPSNPNSVPDGVGGTNSVMEITGEVTELSPVLGYSADFPVESRPEGFGFDNSAEGGLVTSVHIEQYMRAAASVSAAALGQRDAWLACDGSQAGCADALVGDFGRRVFRRPLTDDEVDTYRALVSSEDTVDAGLSVAVQAMLVSPSFLYRSEIGEPVGDAYKLTPWEVATALSYDLWGTTPDAALLDAAASGGLADAEGIETEARRLLADPRAREVVGAFALQWLNVESVVSTEKNADVFPTFDAAVRRAMAEETRQFVNHVVFDGSGQYDELLTAPYTFADANLAAYYGLSGPSGADHVQVDLDPQQRVGLLSHGSVLSTHAYSDSTSPVRRGVFVRRQLLCQTLGTPPPNAGGIPEVDPNATTRERFDQHSSDPACSACHRYIDPVGYGFEAFDGAGAWRDEDNGLPVDDSGVLRGLEVLIDGSETEFVGLPELADLLANSQSAKQCFTRQYFRFARGYHEDEVDDCAVETTFERFAETEFDIQELMVATLTAPEFLYRQ
jgi:hypothetical protein